MFDSTGDSGPPCGVPLLRHTDQALLQDPGVQERPNQLEYAGVPHVLGEPPHQEIVIDSIEKFLQIEVHDPSIAARKVRLRRRHRLMC